MGGALKVIVRFGDGTVVAETRGTNSLPFWIRQASVIEGDESLIRQYVVSESDFRNGDTTYTPVEYGTFTIDFVTKTIIAANDYSDCKQMILLDATRTALRFDIDDDHPGHHLDAMLGKGFLYLESRPLGEKIGEDDKVHYVPHRVDLRHVRFDTWDDLVYQVYDEHGRKNPNRDIETLSNHVYDFLVDFVGWNHISIIERDVESQDAAREKMREIGLPISEADEAAYQAWRAERLEEDRQMQAEMDEED